LKPILLVEDDDVDAMTVQRAFEDLKIANPLVHLSDGEEALVYLKDKSKPEPCVILLDLNMPRMNGIEFLKAVKSQDVLKPIPVVVLTTSKAEQDKIESFMLGIAGYMTKPADYKQFVEMIRMIDLYWTLSELPDGEYEYGRCKI
jgi:CheY-like chemotaxis protein